MPPPTYKNEHRLLYRGALSLPDSNIVLDGVTFTAHLSPTSPMALLESPIALALESMRGRPSLRFVSRVSLADVPHECTGEISMYIHPRSIAAREFFENVLCTEPIGPSGHTNAAIRIGLGDGHGPEESDLLVFGSLLPSQSTLQITVGRVVPPRPPPPRIKLPRPDDPAPRRPSAVARTLAKGKTKAFKLPKLPVPHDAEDVFGTFAVLTSAKSIESSAIEVSNKTMVKKSTVKALAARGMPKEHPGFRELFGWITRGVAFALRNKLKAVNLSNEEVQRLADSHVLMYFDGFGGPNGKG